jgi:hypothetical protein
MNGAGIVSALAHNDPMNEFCRNTLGGGMAFHHGAIGFAFGMSKRNRRQRRNRGERKSFHVKNPWVR